MKPKITDVFTKDDILSNINPHWRPDGCWVWKKNKVPKGYGLKSIKRKGKAYTYYAHHIAYHLWHSSPPNKRFILHKCDFPSCCNPNHLFAGTQKDNAGDKVSKSRQLKGTTHPQAKLTEALVLQIRKEYVKGAKGFGCIALGQKYGVTGDTIWRIVTNRRWKHI